MLSRGNSQSRISFLLSAALACAAMLGAGAAPARAAVGGEFYGVNVQHVFDGTVSAWPPQLSAMSSGGLQVARIDARWSDVEPNPPSGGAHSYNWSKYDAIVQALAQNGLRWYPIVAYSTPWAGVSAGDSNSLVAPAHVADFAAYAAALAHRYGRGGTFWAAHPSLPQLPVEEYEVWNEENSYVFMHPQTYAPEAYADLYMSARAAIKAVDPGATVVLGGLALGNPGVIDEVQFLQRMYAHRPDLAGNVDAVGLHPYQPTLANTYVRLALFRQALDRIAGPAVPIEITEIGWSTTSIPEAERASWLTSLAEDLPRSDCNVTRLIPHTWVTPESNPSDPEDWFGIWNHDGSGKPSGLAYLSAVRLMRGMTGSPPPSGSLAICHPPQQAASAARAQIVRGPRLELKVVKLRRGRWLKVRASCRPACLLHVGLFARPRRAGSAPRRLSIRGAALGPRRKLITLRIRRLRPLPRRAHLAALAVGRSGGVTARSRSVRIR